jgi:hypothetical protein
MFHCFAEFVVFLWAATRQAERRTEGGVLQQLMPEAIDALGSEERHRVYRMIGMEVHLASDGSFELSGEVMSFSKLGILSA